MSGFPRRTFLRYTLRTITAGALSRFGAVNALATSISGDYKALVCVFLLGGNDSHNMVIPIQTTGGASGKQSFADYAAVRPASGIGLLQSQLLPITVNGDIYGLHPSLQNVSTIYASGKAAILANVGNLVQPTTPALYQAHALSSDGTLPVNLMSHSDQQTQWETATPNLLAASGWGGRVADVFAKSGLPSFPMNVSASDGSIFAFGTTTFPASIVAFDPSIALPGNYTSGLAQLLAFNNGLQMVQAANQVTQAGLNQHAVLAQAINALDIPTSQSIQTRFGNLSDPLSAQLETVAQVIAASQMLGVNRQIFFVAQGGYDTHGGESATYAGLLSTLDNALNAFFLVTQDLGIAGQVTTFTNSEFGRNLQPNGNAGTDHAWGGHHLVLGGAVNGGTMYGTFPTLQVGGPDAISADPSGAGILIPSTPIAAYGATLARWFGVSPTNGDMVTLFPTLPNFPSFNAAAGMGFV